MLHQTRPMPLGSSVLADRAGLRIRHGFFTRQGGVSQGIFAGLNVGQGSSDEADAVTENRRRVANFFELPAANLVTAYQIHSPLVVIVTEPFGGQRPQADAMVTNRQGLAIGVLTADCGPVLFADAEAGVIGAAHAGWKGALGGVLENTIAAMETLGAKRKNIVAALGPSISPRNYEVGPEFVPRFTNADATNARYFSASTRQDHAMFDLNRYTIDRLARAGVEAETLNRCTYEEEDLFFSYRRTTHRAEPDYGRQISAIALS